MASHIRFPIGNQSFEKVRLEGMLYIDKTGFIKQLLDLGSYFFLGRPRRFGKSLFLSTLEAYFKGRRELFEGLDISEFEEDWIEYPVIHIDLSTLADPIGSLDKKILMRLKEICAPYGVDVETDGGIGGVVSSAIRRLRQSVGRNVVVLVDEYDVPIHDFGDESLESSVKREVLRSLFLQLKASDENIKFCFVTGVARFNQVSLFSAPNNFKDISMLDEFSTLCGFTHHEIEKYCSGSIVEFARSERRDYETVFRQLAEYYDGYRFTRLDNHVFNPLSIVNSLADRKFDNYWVSTGLTSVFIDKLKRPEFELPDLTDRWVDDESLRRIYDPADPVSLMFQTGYLTIADYDDGYYRLKVPNREVMYALTKDLIPSFMGKEGGGFTRAYHDLRRALRIGDVDRIMQILSVILGSVAYNMYPRSEEAVHHQERFYHALVYFTFMLVSSNVVCEMPSAHGRSDMTAWTDKFIYIFEFKMKGAPDGTVDSAIEQIDKKGYAHRFENDGRKIFKIGVVFSAKERCIADWAVS